jgi:putative flippase GtrA
MIRFSIVGVSNTIIDFLAFLIFYLVLKLDTNTSQALGYSVGILNSFIFNKRWTFKDRKSDKNIWKKTVYEFIQFITVNMISLAVSVLTMDLLIKYVSMNVFLSKAVVILVAQAINFISYKLWVFAPGKSVTT